MSAPLRVVLDTNVVLSTLVFGSSSAGRLRLGWQQGIFVPLASSVTAKELIRVLAYPKFRLSNVEREELLADYLPYVQTVRIPQLPPPVPECRDSLDVPFLHLANAGKAQMLVSGDRDLLALAGEFERTCGCAIVSLAAFLRLHALPFEAYTSARVKEFEEAEAGLAIVMPKAIK